MTPGYFRDLEAQIIDAILHDRPEGLVLLWRIAERHCSDEQLRELRTAARQARAGMLKLDAEVAA